MPIYEYRCSACGHELEALQKITELPLVTCPSCRADALIKLVSAAGFQLKGSGWYATDFHNGNKPAKSDTKSDKSEAKSDGAKDGAKTEPKSEAGAAPAGGCGTGCACH